MWGFIMSYIEVQDVYNHGDDMKLGFIYLILSIPTALRRLISQSDQTTLILLYMYVHMTE